MTSHVDVIAFKDPQHVPTGGPWTATFVWLVFIACLGFAGRFISQNAVNIPFGDDWALLSWSSGQAPLTWEWLWSQHNEHRIPLAKAILIAAYRFSGHDFRIGCWVVLAMLVLLTVVLLLLARHLRGSWSWTDAIFPLTILNLGHCENLIWSFQVQFSSSALLPGLLLVLMIWRKQGPEKMWEILLMGVGGAALCGFGASSIIYAPFIAIWLGYAAWNRSRVEVSGARRQALTLVGMSVLILLSMGLYFFHLRRIEAPPHSAWPVVRTAIQFLSLGISPWFQYLAWPSCAWVPLAIIAFSGLRLLLVFRAQPAERLRCAALLVFLGGLCALSLGVGWGRSHIGEKIGFSSRYATLAMPSVLLGYLVALLYGLRSGGQFWQGGLCVLMVLVYWPNYFLAYDWAPSRTVVLRSFEKDLKAGFRSAVLADTHTDAAIFHGGPRIYPLTSIVAELVVNFRKDRIGPFQPVAADGETRVERFTGDRCVPRGIEWDPKSLSGRVRQSEATLTLSLKQPEYLQRLYLLIHSLRCPTREYPFKVLGLRKNAEPVTLWKGDLFVRDTPAEIRIKIEQEISEIQLVWGAADVEFQMPIAMILAGKAAQWHAPAQ